MLELGHKSPLHSELFLLQNKGFVLLDLELPHDVFEGGDHFPHIEGNGEQEHQGVQDHDLVEVVVVQDPLEHGDEGD